MCQVLLDEWQLNLIFISLGILKGLDTRYFFSACLQGTHRLWLPLVHFAKASVLKGKQLLPGSKFIPIRVNPYSKGIK